MAGKPELSAAPGLQNVVVYVSNDNFAQAYAVGHQHQQHPSAAAHHDAGYGHHAPHPGAHPPAKTFTDREPPPKPPEYLLSHDDQQLAGGHFQNGGFPQPATYHHNGGSQQPKGYCGNKEVLSGERQAGPGRPPDKDCDDGFSDSGAGYVTVVGAEGQSLRCDSVRSETAESSCSSLSSVDEGVVVVHQPQQPPPDMVVYDSGVSVRPGGGGVVLAVAQQHHGGSGATGTVSNSNMPPSIAVPYGWKRFLNNGSVIYISPSNTALSSPEQVKEYLLTAGTCKCGLECHFKYDNTFNFDPKVSSKPWTMSPDTNTGDLTKLCNHKRKIIAMASLDCKPPDPTIRIRKDYNSKKNKRKIGVPYPGCVSVSQILAHREKLSLGQQHFSKDGLVNQQPVWPQQLTNPQMANRIPSCPPEAAHSQHLLRYQDPAGNRILNSPALVMGDGTVVPHSTNNPANISHQPVHQSHQISNSNSHSPNVHVHHQHIIGSNGQVISVQGPMNQVPSNGHPMNQPPVMNSNGGNVVIQSQHVIHPHHQQQHQQRVFINSQPNEPSGPGRPNNIQMIPVGMPNQHQRQEMQGRVPQFYHSPQQYSQIQQYEASKLRPAFVSGASSQMMNGFRAQNAQNGQLVQAPIMVTNHQQKLQWPGRVQQQQQQQPPNTYERVPSLHQHTPASVLWQEEIKRKKVKLGKAAKNRPYHVMECQQPAHAPPCPNIDVRQIPGEPGRSVIISHLPQSSQSASSPSFMEDPSGYLAQQTALLNSTINRQTGANGCTGIVCESPTSTNSPMMHAIGSLPNSQTNEVPLPSNVVISNAKQTQNAPNRTNQSLNVVKTQVPHSIVMSQQYNQMMAAQHGLADSSVIGDHVVQCHGCQADSAHHYRDQQKMARPSSQPGTPSSSGSIDDPVTSSTYSDKQASPDLRPIQGGTVSTSNVSPLDGSQSDPPTPGPHTPTPPHSSAAFALYTQQQEPANQAREVCTSLLNLPHSRAGDICCSVANQSGTVNVFKISGAHTSGVVTTMASGRTVGSNTITSVLAGRANTATVSINSPSAMPTSTTPTSGPGSSSIAVNVSKSPLEMVQSVVSSIQVPQNSGDSNSHQRTSNRDYHYQVSPPHIVKHSPTGLPPGHILVSSGGQLIMANTSQSGVMPPPPPKLVSNQGGMPPISVSPMITNVTGAVSQVIPAVAQQVLGQQTVLVNALPAPFVLQGGVTMTMDGMTMGQNMQLPHLVAGNVIQQQIQIDSSDARRSSAALLSPETKKKGKKRKMSSQTVAGMLHIAAQQNSGVVMSHQQGFPQQLQMAHSPQGLTTGPVMQALTIVPSKNGGAPQLVMNGQAMQNANHHISAQQLITNSQPTQQINLLQPVNLINGTTGVVQNFPTIQQFIVPNLGGMVMNPDGTATLLQDTSNIGMQLQLQNVNGQNVLTPVQSNGMFNIAGPAGMVIRTPPTSQGKIIQQQQHSPGAQFLSPNGGQFVVNGAQFSGQLSPLVASVSPSQQVTFGTSGSQIRPSNSMQQAQQEFIQCGQMGQTLMVPCAPANNIAVSSSNQQNTTFVQQNTTIVQQQTTMVSNNQQLQNFQNGGQPSTQPNVARPVDQNFIISSNDGKQVQSLLVQRESPHHYRQSVSTQTNVNPNTQAVTTNTFCQTSTLSAGSPPDTTTHSPLASGGQSPPTADTTTHSGSTDDGLSPAPSNCSASCDSGGGRQPSCTMAMVHCISSSEPDSATQGPDHDWPSRAASVKTSRKSEDVTGEHFVKKSTTPTHVAYAESSTMVTGLQFVGEQVVAKSQEAVVSSQNFDKIVQNFDKIVQKRKSNETLLVMETHHMHSSLFDNDEDNAKNGKDETLTARRFVVGDLVWGPARTYPDWPGKVTEVNGNDVSVQWFGKDRLVTRLKVGSLQTLSEGLDAHHRARRKCRTSRKLNSQLEDAIQEAMAELDKDSERESERTVKVQRLSSRSTAQGPRKVSQRLRSSQQ